MFVLSLSLQTCLVHLQPGVFFTLEFENHSLPQSLIALIKKKKLQPKSHPFFHGTVMTYHTFQCQLEDYFPFEFVPSQGFFLMLSQGVCYINHAI